MAKSRKAKAPAKSKAKAPAKSKEKVLEKIKKAHPNFDKYPDFIKKNIIANS